MASWNLVSGSYQPDDDDVNVIPNATQNPANDYNMVGTEDHPWHGATFASANYSFMFHSNPEADRIIMGYEVIPNWATTYGRVNIMQSDSESGLAGVTMRQMSETAPMIVFAGTEGSAIGNTFSTFSGGNGGTVGPQGKGNAPAGWKFVKMMKVKINSSPEQTDQWIPIFEKD